MSATSDSEREREKLKEEYKEHYRKIREAKEKLRRSGYVKNVNEALQQMNADELLASVDQFLGKVRNKMAGMEARLDVAMDHLMDSKPDEAELDEQMKKEKAKDTLKQIKLEMGLLYSEIEEQANGLHVDKTVGRKPESDESPAGEKDDKDE